MPEEDFEPRLGRMRAKGKSPKARKFLHRVLASANLARGGTRTGPIRSFSGSRLGRGAGAGRTLASRDHYSAFRSRRVIVKARVVVLHGKGLDAAKAHLRYVERDGARRDGGRGDLYSAASDRVDRAEWLEKAQGDRRQFRFIVSAEDGAAYDDLKSLTRRLMARAEEDLGTRLDWVAVDHYNTGHPHTHIIVRGKDDQGKDLIVARDYMTHGFRERAAELVDLDLGPRTDRDIDQRLQAEVEQERLTSIDRAFIREAAGEIFVKSEANGAFDQAVRVGRLRKLERLGLAAHQGGVHWSISRDAEAILRRMGERGDIIRTMQRAYAGQASAPPLADQLIFDPAAGHPLVGRVVERGIADEHRDSHYAIIEATDGRSHYVELGTGLMIDSVATGAIVRIEPVVAAIREADRTVVAVAAANAGIYTLSAHLCHDTGASETFAEAHVRRLESIRRFDKNFVREADGSWRIGTDHLERAAAYETARVRRQPVRINLLSPTPLDRLAGAQAATWLDREIAAADPEPLRDAGFGREARAAQLLRQRWLVAEGLGHEEGGGFVARPDMLSVLARRELLRVASEIAAERGNAFAEARHGERIEGTLVRPVELLSGRHALVERSRDFTLVPWRPVLERHLGKPVAGILREGGVSWIIGRQRSGPQIT